MNDRFSPTRAEWKERENPHKKHEHSCGSKEKMVRLLPFKNE